MKLLPERPHVIIRPFIPEDIQRKTTTIGRTLVLSQAVVSRVLAALDAEFDTRHFNTEDFFLPHYRKFRPYTFT